jgi:hypothetical protein
MQYDIEISRLVIDGYGRVFAREFPYRYPSCFAVNPIRRG